MTNYIFITGGVVSSLGKGLAAASLGALLQERGFQVRLRKLDPYLNIDPGTMSPFQHGEVYVTDDGTETDLDLGHYERFTGVSSRSSDSITTGKIYERVLTKERRGDYLGATVQVVPHIIDEINSFITAETDNADFIICEIGGTVGDIECQPFLEAIRQLRHQLGRGKTLFIHTTLLPYIAVAGELKTKPSQHSVKELLSYGIQPDILLCRSDREIPEETRRKLGLFCNVQSDCVIPAEDLSSIYEAPVAYHHNQLDTQVCKHFNCDTTLPHLKKWHNIISRIKEPEGAITIAVVGKYIQLPDAYKSLHEALIHAGIANTTKVNIQWVDSEDQQNLPEQLANVHGILVPGGFGNRGIDGKIAAINYARTRKIPMFGICLGMQLAVIESCRHILGLKEASSTEFDDTKEPVVARMSEWLDRDALQVRQASNNLGGTMRLGSYPCDLEEGSLVHEIYGKSNIQERHRHRFEVNINYRPQLETAGLRFSGLSPDGLLPEIVERNDHPWFIGVQFHPELKSKPFDPHPLFVSFVKAAIQQERLV